MNVVVTNKLDTQQSASMNKTQMNNLNKGDASRTNAIFGNILKVPREQRMHSLVELLSLPTEDILESVTASQKFHTRAISNFDSIRQLDKPKTQIQTANRTLRREQGHLINQNQVQSKTQGPFAIPLKSKRSSPKTSATHLQNKLPVFSGAFESSKYEQNQRLLYQSQVVNTSAATSLKAHKKSLSESQTSQGNIFQSLKDYHQSRASELSDNLPKTQSNQVQIPYEIRSVPKVKPARDRSNKSLFNQGFYLNKVPIINKYSSSLEMKFEINKETQAVKDQHFIKLREEYFNTKKNQGYQRENYEHVKPSKKFTEFLKNYMDHESYKAEMKRQIEEQLRAEFDQKMSYIHDRRIQVLKVKRRLTKRKQEAYLKKQQQQSQAILGQAVSEGYHSQSSRESLSQESQMAYGGIKIPDVGSDDELNFEDLFKADDNDLMKILDPETMKAVEDNRQAQATNKIGNKKLKSKKLKHMYAKGEMNPRVEDVCKMFVQTFFADLGEPKEMTIKETKAFLKNQQIDVEVCKQFINEPSTDEEQPVPKLQVQQLEVPKEPNSVQISARNKEIVNNQSSPDPRRQRLDQTMNKIKFFKDIKLGANKVKNNQSVATQQFVDDLRKKGHGSSTAPTKIVDRRMVLENYFLSEAVAFSLGRYFTKLNLGSLLELTLIDNGLRDFGISKLLAGVSGQRTLKKLHISKNEVAQLSAQEIVKCLLWPAPFNLQDITLENVKTTDFAVANIFQALKNAKQLNKLQLSSIQLSSNFIYEYLIGFLKGNKDFSVLKLAWAGLQPTMICKIAKIIARRKKLTHLDLSFNTILTVNEDSSPRSYKFATQFVSSLRKIIVSTQIFHLNLSGMNLGKLARNLVEPIRLSSQLNSIHLSQNNLPEETVLYIDRALTVSQIDPPERKVTRFRETNTQRSSRADYSKPSEDNSPRESILEKDSKFQQLQQQLSESLNRKVNETRDENDQLQRQDPLIYQRIIDMPEFTFPNKFIMRKELFDRQGLLHKISRQFSSLKINKINTNHQEKQNSEYFTQEPFFRWQKLTFEFEADKTQQILENLQHRMQQLMNQSKTAEEYEAMRRKNERETYEKVNVHLLARFNQDRCWACEKRKQVLMVIQKDQLTQEKWGTVVSDPKEVKKIKALYLPNGQMPDTVLNLPVMLSSMNDWFPCHLMQIVAFSMFFDPILAKELQGNIKSTKNNRVEQFQEAYFKMMDHASGEKSLPSDIVQQYSKTWRETIISGLQYLNDTLFLDFPQEHQAVDLENTFAFTSFVKPGNHKLYIFDPSSQLWYYRQILVAPYSFDQPNVKQGIVNQIENQKRKKFNSIFKDRKKESALFFREAFELDEGNWKVNRLIKETEEYAECRNIVFRYYQILHEIFMILAVRSCYPNIESFMIHMFCQETGILDRDMVNVSAVDRLFIAANVSLEGTNDDNAENLFVRYEFIEFLVRIADLKFKQTKVCKTTGQGLQKLVTEHLIAFHKEYAPAYTLFREQYLLLNALDHNFFSNQKLFEHLFNDERNKTKNKQFSRECGSRVAQRLDLTLNESIITYCWGYSKILVKDDEGKAEMYQKLSLIEFLEFLARLFYVKLQFSKEISVDWNQADFLLLNKLQLKRHSGQMIGHQANENQILQEIFELNQFITARMKAYAETQKGQTWVDDQDEVLSDGGESSGQSDDHEDSEEKISPFSAKSNKKPIIELVKLGIKKKLKNTSQLLLTERDIPKDLEKYMTEGLFNLDQE